jgi:hypothetical protein
MAGDVSNVNPDMPYDLRQTYAMYILTPILVKIEEARMGNNFREWYNLLTMSLHTNIYQKLDDEQRKEYDDLNTSILKRLNGELRNCFCGTEKSPQSVYNVQSLLKELEVWLRDKMQKSGLFGNTLYSNMDDEGL